MLRLTLAQMRRSVGRLAAAGVAILIGTAFVAVTLLAGNVITRTTYDSIAAQYAGADLVVTGFAAGDDDVATVRAVEGVTAAEPQVLSFQQLERGARTVYQGVVPTTSDPALLPLEVADGALPAAADEIALPGDLADRLEVSPGDTLTLVRTVLDDPATGASHEVRDELTVSGVVDDPYGAYAMLGGAAVATPDAVARWEADLRGPGEDAAYEAVLVALADGTDVDAARDALASAIGDPDGPGAGATAADVDVVTPDERAAAVAAEMTGGEDLIFTTFVLVFAAVALLVDRKSVV